MSQKNISARRYQRVKLDATILISNAAQQSMLCYCLELSEDSLELEPMQQASLFDEFKVKAGDVIQVQINHIQDAPMLSAAVVKISPTRIGLRLIDNP